MTKMSYEPSEVKGKATSGDAGPRPGRYLSSAAVFLICLGLYGATMSRSISGGDAGELAVSACQLGVAHPPGYPLFTFLYHWVWRYVKILFDPFAVNAAIVFNFTSVALMSLGVALLCSSIFDLTRSHIVSAVTSAAFAFSPTVWLYSGQAEVFALHIFFMALLLKSLFWVHASPNLNRATIFNFIASLTLTNQHTSILFVAPFSVLLMIREWRLLCRPKTLASIALSGAAGMSPYLLLPYFSSQHNLDSWGDQTTLEGFLRHLLRQEYGTFQLASTEIATNHPFLSRILIYAQHSLAESYYFFAILGLFGMALSFGSTHFKPHRPALVSLAAAYCFYIGVFHYLANLDLTPFLLGVQMRFWMQPNMVVFLWASLAWSRLRSRFHYVFDAVAVAVLSLQIAQNIVQRDFSSESPVRAYGESVLKSLPPNSIALLNGDLNNNAVKYLTGCESDRSDLRLISLQLMSWEWFIPAQARHYPGVVFPGEVYHPFRENGFSILQFLEANRERFQIFLCGDWKLGDDSHQQFYDLIPSGICNKVVRKDQLPSDRHRARIVKRGALALPKLSRFDASRITPDLWESIVYNDVWQRKITHFNELAGYAAGSNGASRRDLKIAANLANALFEETPADADRLQPEIFRNAGVIFGLYSAHDSSYELRMFQSWHRYLNRTDKPDSVIANLVQQHYNPYRGSTVA